MILNDFTWSVLTKSQRQRFKFEALIIKEIKQLGVQNLQYKQLYKET